MDYKERLKIRNELDEESAKIRVEDTMRAFIFIFLILGILIFTFYFYFFTLGILIFIYGIFVLFKDYNGRLMEGVIFLTFAVLIIMIYVIVGLM